MLDPTCQTQESALAIQAEGIVKTYGRVRAVDSLSLSVKRGEYLALLGPNGAGKTTLVEMFEGLREPDQGIVRILGQGWRENGRALQKKLGIALQETRFIDKLNVLDTLQLFASFYGLASSSARRSLEIVQLQESAKILTENLSGGQKQRLALAIAIIHQPELLILDEPTVGLDPHARRELWSILRRMRDQCTTLILTTHYMDEAEALCDRIVIMDHGRILAQGSVDDLRSEHAQGEVIEFALEQSGLSRAAFDFLPEHRAFAWDATDRTGSLTVASAVRATPGLFQEFTRRGWSLAHFNIRKASLEDLFIQLTGRRLDE
jgi:ABC-2 type transport system ATP-binding protein